MSETLRDWRPGPAAQLCLALAFALAAALALVGPGPLLAQIEGDRGIPPVANSTDIEVNGVEVNVTGENAEDARQKGWLEAQRKAWEVLKGPKMPDSQIAGMVSAVIIEQEQIGPRRYVARLGVIFDRARAGQFVAAGGNLETSHSAPMLVIPVLYSGGSAQVFEVRGPWQRAWAQFRAGASAVDYVRPVGSGGESLILTAGQPGRRSRIWWRNVLDQFGAADVIVPIARLERQWPGGPVRGTFTARYGPDNTWLGSFELSANNEAGVPAMLNTALRRFDEIYSGALAAGILRPDPTLIPEQITIDPALAQLIATGSAPQPTPTTTATPSADRPAPSATGEPVTDAQVAVIAGYTVQFASPDGATVDATLGAVRGAAGVQGAATTSIAIGGTSVMRVSFAGSIDELAAALRSRGFQVSGGGSSLSIRR